MQGYTAAELERETGVDRRTIAFYVQEGLLPKVGRRGSRSRYPDRVRDRLLFIRRVREAERAGTVEPVSLNDIRTVFENAPSELISSVADGRVPVTPKIVASPSTGARLRRLSRRRDTLSDRWTAPLPEAVSDFAEMAAAPVGYPDPPLLDDGYAEASVEGARSTEESALGETLSALQVSAGRDRDPDHAVHRWLEVEVSPDIKLSVRGAPDAAAALLARAGERLGRLMDRRPTTGRPEPET